MNKIKWFAFFFAPFLISFGVACAPKPQTSILLNNLQNPSQSVQEVLAREGKSDYFLLRDEGYSLRLIYLCANRIYNFVEDPDKNHIFASLQPILDSQVEEKLSPHDRQRIWACKEKKVREELSQVVVQRGIIEEERIKLSKEIVEALSERDRIAADMEFKRRLAEQEQRRIEEEMRKAEEERLRQVRKAEEEQRRKSEEERKITGYRVGEKEKEKEIPLPVPAPIPEIGIFLVMKDTRVQESAQNNSKMQDQIRKYDIFGVISSQRDKNGMTWHQVVLGERFISKKEKKFGWTPEEKSFWGKNKLLAWVYPGDLAKINTAKPLRFNIEEIQFTGIRSFSPQKNHFYEITYEITVEYIERAIGWVREVDGIFRADKNTDEMMELLKKLAKTLWPLKIQNDILRGFIRLGFTSEQVVLSWGPADHVNTTRTLLGVHDQWVYGKKPFPKAYVYFENGVVKNWEFLKK